MITRLAMKQKLLWVLQCSLSIKVLLCVFCVAAVASASFPTWYLTYNAGVSAMDNIARDFQLRIVPQISNTILTRLSRYQ